MTLREILADVEKCKSVVPEDQWDKFLDTTVYVHASEEVDPQNYEITGLCGQFLEFGVELLIQPRQE